jgi:RimJ/RimL family protein N-acetyltransferase
VFVIRAVVGVCEAGAVGDSGEPGARCKTCGVKRPVLGTTRLELIPLDDDHLDFEVELHSDPDVLRYLDGRALTRAEVEQAHQRRLRAGQKIPGLGFWVGFSAARFVGFWMLQPPHGPDQREIPGEADLGYRLMRRFWRQGLASEGARELLRYGFLEVGLRRIFGQTLAVNDPARAVMGSIGMTYVRAFPSASPEPLVAGSERGEVEYEITRDQWVAQTRLR